jgi:HK97 family phage major capsid protein
MRTPAVIMAEMQAIVDLSTAETRSLNDEEIATYEGLEGELKSANKTADLFARQEAYKSPIVGFPAVIKPAPKGDDALEFAFDNYLRTGIPNADIAQLYAQTEGTPSAGGYAVPDTFRTKLTERRVAFGGLMSAAENITTTDGRPLQWPSVAPALSSEADIAAEGAASAAGADITFDEVTLGAYKYASTGTANAPIKVSVELLQDASFDIGAFVAKRLGERIARKQAYDIIRGSGSGEPLGIAYGTGGTVESDLAGFADFNDLVHALDPDYRKGAKWIMNDATAKLIENLLDGASGTSGRPLLQTSTQGIESGTAISTLMGYEVIIDQAMPDMNTDDVIGIAFGLWNEAYIVRHVKDVQVLVNPYAATGYVVYDAWARMDGTVQNSYAYVTGEGV